MKILSSISNIWGNIKANKWATIITSLAGLIVISTALGKCYLHFFPTDEMRKISAEARWPKLEVCNTVTCDSLFTKWGYSARINTSIFDPYYNLEVKLNCSITNRGNVAARLFGILYTDTLSDSSVGRRIIFDKIYRDTHLANIDSLGYKSYELNLHPGDTLTIHPKLEVQYSKNEFSLIHLLLFYQNEQEMYFDTYCWIELQTRPLVYIRHGSYYVADTRNYAKIKRGGQEYKCYYKIDEIEQFRQFQTDLKEYLNKKYRHNQS